MIRVMSSIRLSSSSGSGTRLASSGIHQPPIATLHSVTVTASSALRLRASQLAPIRWDCSEDSLCRWILCRSSRQQWFAARVSAAGEVQGKETSRIEQHRGANRRRTKADHVADEDQLIRQRLVQRVAALTHHGCERERKTKTVVRSHPRPREPRLDRRADAERRENGRDRQSQYPAHRKRVVRQSPRLEDVICGVPMDGAPIGRQARGLNVRLLPAQYVRPYVRRNKTDRTDTEALLEAHRCGGIQRGPCEAVEQQTLQALRRLRTQWQSARTARINVLRGLLREQGVAVPASARL